MSYLREENERLRTAFADCKQLAKGEQSLLDSLMELNAQAAATEAERQLLEQERDTALYELEREQRSHAVHHGAEPR